MDSVEKLIENLAREAAPVRPAPHPFMLSLGWIAAAALYLLATLWLSGLRPDLMQKIHEPWFAAEVAALALVFVAASLSAAALAYPDLHQMRKTVVAPAALLALFLAIMSCAWRADVPPALLPVHSSECTISIVLVAIVPAAWTFFSMRRFAATHYGWAGAVALLSAFGVGALWLRLHEANDSIVHVVQWHYLPMLGVGLVGWWLGKTFLKW